MPVDGDAATPDEPGDGMAAGRNPAPGGANPLPPETPKAPPAPQPATQPEPPRVEVSEPSFVGGGEVPKVASFLERMKTKAADCIVANDPAARGKMKIQFLVSLRARAEGVDVMSADDFNEEAQKCVRDAIKGGRVETPTADPTGVQFTFTFK